MRTFSRSVAAVGYLGACLLRDTYKKILILESLFISLLPTYTYTFSKQPYSPQLLTLTINSHNETTNAQKTMKKQCLVGHGWFFWSSKKLRDGHKEHKGGDYGKEGTLVLFLRISEVNQQVALNGLQVIQQTDSIDITIKREMCQSKRWKAQEDEILKEIYQKREIKQWSEIAKIMEKEYSIAGRNGKQCRERYHNHLKGGISKEKWTPHEENLLIQLHSQHGNRWAMISKLIPGRSQNCIKNMLYSRMRRSVRLLNRFIFLNYRKQLKEINISFMYRLIDFTEKSYKKTENSRNQQEIISIRLKNSLLMLDYNEETPLDEIHKNNIKQLIEDIHVFKRVNQRYRGNNQSKKTQRLFKSKNTTTFDNTNKEEHLIKDQRPTPSNFYLMEDNYQSFEGGLLLQEAGEGNMNRRLQKRMNKLDSLDSNRPFLKRNQSNLQKQIPMELPQLKSLMNTYQEIRDSLEGELNNWEDYISQF